MKYIITTILAVSLSFAAYSQNSIYTMNYTMGIAAGDMAKYIGSTSFRGFTFEGRGFVTNNVTLGGLFTWQTFYEEQRGATYEEGTFTLTGNQYRYINAFPMLFQAHYYLHDDQYAPRVYLGGGLGAYKINRRTEAGTWALDEREWHFGVSPEVGVLLPVSMTTQFNISMRYHYALKTNRADAYSWFGLSVGFAWGD